MDGTEKTPGQQIQAKADMLVNNAGGFVWQITDLNRLQRFLVLGSENGTYYTSQKTLGFENVRCVARLIKEGRGTEVVETIRQYSVEGRCANQNAIVYCLAICARFHDEGKRFEETSRAAYKALPEVCRIPTDLFNFVQYCETISKCIDEKSGWGRAHRKAISKWYCEKPAQKLAYLVTKYKQRNGWSNRDLLRLCHAKAGDDKCIVAIFKYIVKGYDKMKEEMPQTVPIQQDLNHIIGYLTAVENAKKAKTEDELYQIICQHDLVREHIPTQFLSFRKIWIHLVKNMPMTAMIRNLGKMSSVGLFEDTDEHPGEKFALKIAAQLTNEELLKTARIHPFKILLALEVYRRGEGDKGSNKWEQNKHILTALDKAFYLAFKLIEPTKKRYLLGIDVSGSMDGDGCHGEHLITPAVAAAAMAMVALKTEETVYPMAFSNAFVPLAINKEMDLPTVLKTVRKVPMGATDCALPMIYALEKKIPVDVFIIYTDCETWIGAKHPCEALQDYRIGMDIPDAKMIVCAMTSTGFTIGDPNDPYTLDIVGFDSAAPEIISKFSLGQI